MIYTVTFNPAIDYILRLDEFRAGSINRVTYEKVLGGGKGINVSIVLSNLGLRSTALGFLAGFTGSEIKRQLKKHSITMGFVELSEGFTRINVKIKAETETEINGDGPAIDDAKISELYARLEPLTKGDILVLSGSIPGTLPADVYEQVMKRIHGKGVSIIVDAEKKLLESALKYRPYLIKPNKTELSEYFEAPVENEDEVLRYAKELQKQGAQNVLVSMAEEGAMLITEAGDNFRVAAPRGKVVNSVGAGDSMVAGFIAGLIKDGGDFYTALCYGVAAGSASAFSENLATLEEVENLLQKIVPREYTRER